MEVVASIVAAMAPAIIVLIIVRTRLLISTMTKLLIVVSGEAGLTEPTRSIPVATLALNIPSPSVTTIVEWRCTALCLLHHCFWHVLLESGQGSALPFPSTNPALSSTLRGSRHHRVRIEHGLRC